MLKLVGLRNRWLFSRHLSTQHSYPYPLYFKKSGGKLSVGFIPNFPNWPNPAIIGWFDHVHNIDYESLLTMPDIFTPNPKFQG